MLGLTFWSSNYYETLEHCQVDGVGHIWVAGVEMGRQWQMWSPWAQVAGVIPCLPTLSVLEERKTKRCWNGRKKGQPLSRCSAQGDGHEGELCSSPYSSLVGAQRDWLVVREVSVFPHSLAFFLEVMDTFVILIIVIVWWVCVHVQTHQIVYIKHLQFFVCQLHINKAVKNVKQTNKTSVWL